RKQFFGAITGLPPGHGMIGGGSPADDSDVRIRRFNLGKNQTTAPRVRTRGKYIKGFRMDSFRLKRSPHGYGRFKGPLTLSVPGRSNYYSVGCSARSNQLVRRPLGITPTTLFPSVGYSFAASRNN